MRTAIALAAVTLCGCAKIGDDMDKPPHMEPVQFVEMGPGVVYLREVVTQDGNFCVVATSSGGVALQCHIPDTIDKGMKLPP